MPTAISGFVPRQRRTLPNRPLCSGRGSSAESGIGDLSRPNGRQPTVGGGLGAGGLANLWNLRRHRGGAVAETMPPPGIGHAQFLGWQVARAVDVGPQESAGYLSGHWQRSRPCLQALQALSDCHCPSQRMSGRSRLSRPAQAARQEPHPHKEAERRGAEQSGQATNRALSSQRLVWEQVSRKRKVCKILAERYRNRRRRFGLRLNLLAGLYNLELGRPKCLAQEVS